MLDPKTPDKSPAVMEIHHGANVGRFFRFSTGLAVMAGGAVLAYFLNQNPQVSLLAILPFLLIGGCLLMQLFMPHGRRRQDRGSHGQNEEKTDALQAVSGKAYPHHRKTNEFRVHNRA